MEDNNEDFYEIKQQKKVLVDTEQMVPAVQKRLKAAAEDLEMFLETIDEDTEEKQQALAALKEAQTVYEGSSHIHGGDELFTDVS